MFYLPVIHNQKLSLSSSEIFIFVACLVRGGMARCPSHRIGCQLFQSMISKKFIMLWSPYAPPPTQPISAEHPPKICKARALIVPKLWLSRSYKYKYIDIYKLKLNIFALCREINFIHWFIYLQMPFLALFLRNWNKKKVTLFKSLT